MLSAPASPGRARILAATAAFLFAFTANAADPVNKGSKIAVPAAAQAEEVPQWNRAGFYVGGVAAYDVAVLEAEGLDLAAGKLMAGGFVGWNFRCGPTCMMGIEGDWMFTGISASTAAEEVFLKASTQHLVSLRARAGIPMGPALLYVTAGPAWQQQKLTIDDSSDTKWLLGAAFGGGAEVEITRAMFLRIEALHYVFPEDGNSLADLLESGNQHTTARVGLGFKLN